MANVFDEILANNPGYMHADPEMQENRALHTINTQYFGDKSIPLEERIGNIPEYIERLRRHHTATLLPGTKPPDTMAGLLGDVSNNPVSQLLHATMQERTGTKISAMDYMRMSPGEVLGTLPPREPIVTQSPAHGIDWWDVDPDAQLQMDHLRRQFQERDDLYFTPEDIEPWRKNLPNAGFAYSEPVRQEHIPEPDFSIIDRLYRKHNPPQNNAMITAESIKETGTRIKAGAERVAENVSRGLKELKETNPKLGTKVEWVKNHKLASVGLVAGAALLRRHQKRQISNITRQSATISRGSNNRPAGSAAGLDAAPSAYIQMNGAGYDNPNMQGARYGTTFKPAFRSPSMSRPSGLSTYSGSVGDYRRRTSNVTLDTQLSNMI